MSVSAVIGLYTQFCSVLYVFMKACIGLLANK